VTATIIVQPEAEDDLDEAFRWYQARRDNLGHEFLEAASQAFARIANQPLRYAPVHREAGRILLHRFPYVVLYVPRDDQVFVLAVLHQRRHQRIARARSQSFKGE
jgi:plasmid stabilization system protein ParE